MELAPDGDPLAARIACGPTRCVSVDRMRRFGELVAEAVVPGPAP